MTVVTNSVTCGRREKKYLIAYTYKEVTGRDGVVVVLGSKSRNL